MEKWIEELAWELTETKVEEVITPEVAEDLDTSPTLVESIYDASLEEKKSEIQKEIEREAAEYQIPEPTVEETTGETVTDEVSVEIELKAAEEDVKEVIEEIRKETDLDKQNKQWEELLLSLREDILWLERKAKEDKIEIKTLDEKNKSLIQENKDLKYSDKVKLDDELDYLNYLRNKMKANPSDAETKKQLWLYHLKAYAGIYPEYDYKAAFDEVRVKKQQWIDALTSWSEGMVKEKAVEVLDKRVQTASLGIPVKRK